MDSKKVKIKFEALAPHLDERMRRIVAASETLGESYGVISEVSRATGVSRRAISQGIEELTDTDSINTTEERAYSKGRRWEKKIHRH
jgi:hypothetical protein